MLGDHELFALRLGAGDAGTSGWNTRLIAESWPSNPIISRRDTSWPSWRARPSSRHRPSTSHGCSITTRPGSMLTWSASWGYDIPNLLARLLAKELGSEASQADILDLGCGTGLFGASAKPRCNSIVGIDLSRRMLAAAATAGPAETPALPGVWVSREGRRPQRTRQKRLSPRSTNRRSRRTNLTADTCPLALCGQARTKSREPEAAAKRS